MAFVANLKIRLRFAAEVMRHPLHEGRDTRG
jgi:hypothetical protein